METEGHLLVADIHLHRKCV